MRIATLMAVSAPADGATHGDKPNFIVFLCDNLGYGDIGPYGSTLNRTPNLDRLAREGRMFRSFYTAGNVCTPSRAGLMTGSYPRRLGIYQNPRGGAVLQPGEPIGLHPSEITIAEVLKSVGYSTMLIGKWHLGDQLPFLPTRQGFDRYYGVPYSDDMTPRPGMKWPPLPLMKDEIVVEAPVDRAQLTQYETRAAIDFIQENRGGPFFLLISHAMPGSTGSPFASAAFKGKSKNGPYGDAVEELDWSAGEILRTLDTLGLRDRTLVLWTSDNSAQARRDPGQIGTNAPLTGFMRSTSEGGFRVPFIARWPGRVPAGTVTDELATMMDLLPTFAALAGAQSPGAEIVDGKNIGPLFLGEQGATTPHRAFFFYQFDQLQAVRSGPWKLFLRLEKERGAPTQPAKQVRKAARLYHVVEDPAEKHDVAAHHAEVIVSLTQLADIARAEIGDFERQGTKQRPAGWIPDPDTRRLPVHQ